MKNLIKVYQKMKVGNKTQLLTMCAYKTMKMDVYLDTCKKDAKYIHLYI